MRPTARVEQGDFQAKLLKAAALTRRPLGQFVTSRLWHVADEARRLTPVASRPTIQTELGAMIKSERVNSKGKTLRRYSYSPTPLVYAIVNARRRRSGKPPIPRGEMATAAKKLIQSRLRAVGSLRAGWTRALGILGAAIKKQTDRSGPRVKNTSTATPAREGWKPEARLEYRLTVRDGGNRKIDPRAVQALQGGFNKEKMELTKRLEGQVRSSLREAGAL